MASPLRRLVVGGAIALILAAACSTDATTTTSGADDDTTSDPITSAEPVEDFDEQTINEEAFTAALLAEGVFLDVPDSTLIDIAHRVCDDFDSGVTFTELAVQAATDPVLRDRSGEVGFLVGAATIFCPEHRDELPG